MLSFFPRDVLDEMLNLCQFQFLRVFLPTLADAYSLFSHGYFGIYMQYQMGRKNVKLYPEATGSIF